MLQTWESHHDAGVFCLFLFYFKGNAFLLGNLKNPFLIKQVDLRVGETGLSCLLRAWISSSRATVWNELL
jgi:hypothetical protein